jgi:glycerol-1-phosphate dehydrogenase [NAD(P)+]
MRVWSLPHIDFVALHDHEEKRLAALITDAETWGRLKPELSLPVAIQAEPNRSDLRLFDELAQGLPTQIEVVYAVGDGFTVDAAKLIASANKKPLVIVPTAISADDLFDWTCTTHEDDTALEIETGAAESVIMDLDIIGASPAHLRGAGIVDALSIVTALMDWGYANGKNELPPDTKYVQWAAGMAASIAAQAVKIAGAVGRGELDSLRTLVDLLCLMVRLDAQLGHRRASQGVEHLFAEALTTSGEATHAERIAPGILIASALHGKDPAGLRAAIEASGVRLRQVPIDDIRATLNTLPDYAREVDAPYSILNDLQANDPKLEDALTRSGLLNQ